MLAIAKQSLKLIVVSVIQTQQMIIENILWKQLSTIPETLSRIFKGHDKKSGVTLNSHQRMTLFRLNQQIQVKLRLKLIPNYVLIIAEMDASQPGGLSSYLSQEFKLFKQELAAHTEQLSSRFLNVQDKVSFYATQGVFFYTRTLNLLPFQSGQSFNLDFCIDQILGNFSKIIENIIFKFNLAGLGHSQWVNSLKNDSNRSLTQSYRKILVYKQIFELYRCQVRKEAESITLKLTTQQQKGKQIQTVLAMVGSGCHPRLNNNSLGIVFNSQMLEQYKKRYKEQVKLIIRSLIKEPVCKQPILTGIEITKEENLVQISSGGFSNIFTGLFSYIPQLSINQVKLGKKEEEKTGQQLILKQAKNQISLNAIKNQCYFLIHFRNRACPFIAQYYCKKAIEPFKDCKIYMEFYPRTINSPNQRPQNLDEMLKMFESVCLGLLFLRNSGVIHRDLKESNVMIDRCGELRIIDFGSVSSISKKTKKNEKQNQTNQKLNQKPFNPPDKRLTYTPDYNIFYWKACEEIPSLSEEMTQEQYESHQNYDVFSLGKMMENKFLLHKQANSVSFVEEQIKYLALKCMEVHPEDRWSLDKILIFLRELMTFQEQQRKCWQVQFEKRFRPFNLNHRTVATLIDQKKG